MRYGRGVSDPLIPRKVATQVTVALADTRVVLISGARQAGKSTLVRVVAGDGRRQPLRRSRVEADFAAGPLVVDDRAVGRRVKERVAVLAEDRGRGGRWRGLETGDPLVGGGAAECDVDDLAEGKVPTAEAGRWRCLDEIGAGCGVPLSTVVGVAAVVDVEDLDLVPLVVDAITDAVFTSSGAPESLEGLAERRADLSRSFP